jgi:four helix bundle protein
VVVSSFRDLRVWQAGMDLVVDIYKVTETFPRSEMFGLASQMQRAAVSVPSNIAEGHTRAYTREYLHHVAIAHGSLAELQTQLDVALRLGFVNPVAQLKLATQATSLSKQLSALRTALAERTPNSQLPTPNSHHRVP